MVLKLREICLNFVTKNFDTISNFDQSLLYSPDKEKIIERLANHNLLSLNNKYNNRKSYSETEECLFRQRLIRNFFTGHLNSIKFNGCTQLDDSFLVMLVQIPANQLVFKSINFYKCRILTDAGIRILMQTYSANLEDLSLTNFSIPLNQTLNESIRSFKLTNVDLSYCPMINDTNLESLCQNNPVIKCLKISYCKLITNNGVNRSLQLLDKLEFLDIEGIGSSGSGFYKSDGNLNLKSLSFSGTHELNNPESEYMSRLFKSCPKLKELHLLYSKVSDGDLSFMDLPLGKSPLNELSSNLVSLSLYRPNIKNSQVIIESLKSLINLEHLSLNAVECLNDDGLMKIFENNGKNLRSIRLSGYMVMVNSEITNATIKSLVKHCKKLAILDFEQLSLRLDFEPLNRLIEQRVYACEITELGFSACRNLSDGLLQLICVNCINLKNLDLSGLNVLVTDELIENLASSAKHLVSLNIKACTKITDTSICALSTKCSYIQSLVLAGINSLTDKAIFSISNHLQFTLREIYLSGCSKISKTSLRYLTDCCVNRLVCPHYCPNSNPNEIYVKNLDTGYFERF